MIPSNNSIILIIIIRITIIGILFVEIVVIIYFVGNKPKRPISKRVFQENKTCQILRKKTNFFPPDAYQGVRNVCFLESLTCFVLMKHQFWDLPFWLITDDFCWNISIELAQANICQHHCIANKIATIRKITLFKGAWCKFQYRIRCWFFITPVYRKFPFFVHMFTVANWT